MAVRCIALACLVAGMLHAQPAHPNILFIYLDDLGYGDLSTTNPESRILTPNIDRLAQEGMTFSDAHAPAAVCGPSRYGLLTGRYPWRRGPGGMGNGAKFRDLFMEADRPTVATLLRQAGYNTAQMGKWGLRHNYSAAVKPGREPGDLDAYDFVNRRLLGAQLVGFDYSWAITYLDRSSSDIKFQFENGRPVDPSLTPTDPYRWLPDSADKVVEYLRVHAGRAENARFGLDRDKPFFIYWDPPSPHAPYVPNAAFVGRSGAGIYGDFVMEIDHHIGRMLAALDELDLAGETLVVFASDNGSDSLTYERLREFGHAGMGSRRGVKTDVFEGGHRVPLIVRLPGVVAAKRQSSALICFTDWFATFAELTGQPVPPGAAEDSVSFLNVLRNEDAIGQRKSAIHHSTRGSFAIRHEEWIYIDDDASPSDEPQWYRDLRGVVPSPTGGQLYNLSADPAQTRNLATRHPERVARLKALLAEARATP